MALGHLSMVAVVGACVLGGAACARLSGLRRVMIGLVGTAIIAADQYYGVVATVALAHLHNVLALVLWWTFRLRRRRCEYVLPCLAVTSAVAIFLGALDGLVLVSEPWSPQQHELADSIASSLSFGSDPEAGGRWLRLFVFGQSVHYMIWLRAVPDDLRGRSAPRAFVASYRALRAELGAPLLIGAAALSVGLLVWALYDVASARDGYLRLALFHGPLEFGCAALAMAGRRRP